MMEAEDTNYIVHAYGGGESYTGTRTYLLVDQNGSYLVNEDGYFLGYSVTGSGSAMVASDTNYTVHAED